MVKAVIFDMDGLMFDTERLSKGAWQEVGERTGYPITEDMIRRFRGATAAVSRKILAEAFGSGFDYDANRAMRSAIMQENIDKNGLPVKPGLYSLLEALQKWEIPCALASSSIPEIIAKYLSLSHLEDRFEAIISGEDVTRSKPAPDCFQAAADALAVPYGDCLVLEDSANGLLAAHAAGMQAICIPDIAMPVPEALTHVRAVLPSLHEVIGWIAAENGI